MGLKKTVIIRSTPGLLRRTHTYLPTVATKMALDPLLGSGLINNSPFHGCTDNTKKMALLRSTGLPDFS
jgi:hypothetical protein